MDSTIKPCGARLAIEQGPPRQPPSITDMCCSRPGHNGEPVPTRYWWNSETAAYSHTPTSSTAGSTSCDSNIYSWGKSWFSKLLRDIVGGQPKDSGPVVISNGNAEGPESRSAPRCRVVTDAPTHKQIPIRILLQTWKFGLSFSNCRTGCNRNPACADLEKHWRENCGTDAIIVTSLRHLRCIDALVLVGPRLE